MASTRPTGRSRREEGQAVTAIGIVVMMILVSAALTFVFRFGKGTSEISKIQSGADAAALAGAQDVVDLAWDKIDRSLDSKSNEFLCGDGQGRASSFARANSTNVTSYCYSPLSDRVEVTVRSDFVTATERRESQSSVAELGLRLGPCVVITIPSQTGYYTTATCGEVVVDVYVDSSGNANLVTTPPQLEAMFRVTLRD